ncbi:MAG TPA: S24/S26 family peptidase [Candidatus Krumholzibacteria bacterium]|nr:S24/S26 family peptidase [Candidatus Krumholzibacteria bacterium]
MCENRANLDEAAGQWRLLRGDVPPSETVRLTVRSGSMAPFLPVGAEIEVAPASGSECRVGDVVVFRRGDRLIVHRLLFGWGGEPGAWFLQRGDGVSPLGFVRARSILGRVVAVHEAGGACRRFDQPADRLLGVRQARRSLARIVLATLKAPARKAKRWFQRENTGSG